MAAARRRSLVFAAHAFATVIFAAGGVLAFVFPHAGLGILAVAAGHRVLAGGHFLAVLRVHVMMRAAVVRLFRVSGRHLVTA